jgi:hypothetical protein
MSSFKLQGAIKMIGDTVKVSEKFSKRDVVITDASTTYPQDIQFQFVQDKCDALNGLSVGQQIEISFNLKGREWTSPTGDVKYFNTLEGWRVDVVGGSSASPSSAPAALPAKGDDDLPF